MDCRVLKLVIQSAHGLKDVNHVTTMKPYALVSIRDNQNNLHSSEEKTPEDTGGGSNPTWNSPVTFNNLDITKAKESNLELVVKLMSLRTDHWFRDKEIGEVRVFITKLLEGFGGKAKADAVVAEKQMSASVMTTDEKPQGTLVFSYKFESVTTVQKPARQKNFPTAQQNVQQNPEQPAGLGNPLISKTVKGIVGTASNNIGLTSAVASDATATPPPRAMQTRAAAANQRGADDPSEGNNKGIAGTALNTTGLTSASNAAAAPPSPAIQTHVAAVDDQRGTADDPSEDNNERIAGTALNTPGLTSASDVAAAPPSPAIQTRVAAAVDQGGTNDPSEDNNEGIVGTALNTTGLTSASDAAATLPSPAIQTRVATAVDQGGADDPSENNNEGIMGTALNTTGLTSASDAAAALPSPGSQTRVAATVDQDATDDPSEYNNDEGEDDGYEDEGFEDEA